MFARTPETARQITVVLADDHALFREGLAMAIEQRDGLDLVGQATDGLEALEMIQRLEPDVAILDVQMPGVDGLGVCERLAAEGGSKVRLVLLSAFVEPALVERADRAGAAAYMSKNASRQEICDTVVAVMAGERRFPALDDAR
ncbi:MAG: two-component system, NarL family, nitrate/nitrite response regulator NarL [Solirubrobacteraceae bacterium]|nr:two-component system, NarL family, nitrate/nitrite response regulator NarL [Solirubrobacteraceae bacterium]